MVLELSSVSDVLQEPPLIRLPLLNLLFSYNLNHVNIRKLSQQQEKKYKSKLQCISELFNLHKDMNIYDSYSASIRNNFLSFNIYSKYGIKWTRAGI
jgi:hypothetical protein